MLHLRRAGMLELNARTASGMTLGDVLDWWEQSERRARLRAVLKERDGIDPDEVIMTPDQAARRGMTSTVCFPGGNLAPGGSVIKSTALDPSVVDADGIYRKTGPAKVFTTERAAITAVKDGTIKPGDIMVLCARGPMGSGMEEVYQLTAALRHLSFGKHVALLTDARFSGISAGACIGHVTPEALAGGPIGKVRDGDTVRIVIDRKKLEGTVDLLGPGGTVESGTSLLEQRGPREDLQPDPELPDDTRLWAALQDVSGGSWGGSVFDVEAIVSALEAGRAARAGKPAPRHLTLYDSN
jgi:dihydroxyacid dehydratase/phosphogluconate dehydratase